MNRQKRYSQILHVMFLIAFCRMLEIQHFLFQLMGAIGVFAIVISWILQDEVKN